MLKDNDEMKRQLDKEVQLRIKLQEEMAKMIKTYENETQLRLQFETKLNSLHSLHRDL